MQTLLFMLMLSIISACTEQVPTNSSTSLIETVHWNKNTSTLHMKGHGLGDGSKVSIYNEKTNEKIATTLITNNHYWTLQLKNIESPPCSIKAEVNQQSATQKVTSAPATCNSNKTIRNRRIDNASLAVTPLVTAQNLPNGWITSPVSNISITAGDSVFFNSDGSPDIPSNPLQYQWDFNGAAKISNIQNPGAIRFTKPGSYQVKLTVSNQQGSDISPAIRYVTVKPVSTSILAAPPLANIDSPIGPQTIFVGDSIFFAGSGFDPAATGPLNYLWNFEGAAPNSTVQNPGLISFNQAGVFSVTLTVFDLQGNRNVDPVSIVITVLDATGGTNIPPSGEIISPAADLIISSGSGIFMQGSGIDEDGNMPLTYFWDFAGAAANSFEEIPGIVMFASPGVYPVTLMVADALGAIDPNPSVRVITVLDATVNNSDFPVGMIVTPDADVTINVGDSITFTADGSSPAGNDPLSYMWSFGDPDIPDSMEQNPPPVTFNTPGVFTVSMLVTDSIDQAAAMPAEIVVTVLDPAAAPAAGPTGEILSPPGDVTIEAGMAVDFQGEGEDAAGNNPITYLWNFGDPAIPDSMEQSPGPVIFDVPGMYTVTLITINSIGEVDTTPPQVVITVVEPGATPPADPAPADPPPADPVPPTDPVPPDPAPAPLADAPDGMILSPPEDVTILVGDTIELVGVGADPNGSPLEFFWDIDGGVGNSSSPSPGNTTFNMVGIWDIELTVTNSEGIADPSPARVKVTVLPDAPAP